MKIKEDLILNWTGFKFFVKMAKIKGCINSKTNLETKPQKKKKVKTETKGSFWNKNQTTQILMQHHVRHLHGSIIVEFKRENIVWVITIIYIDCNSHGNCYPYTNSQGTLPQQHPWDIFLKSFQPPKTHPWWWKPQLVQGPSFHFPSFVLSCKVVVHGCLKKQFKMSHVCCGSDHLANGEESKRSCHCYCGQCI